MPPQHPRSRGDAAARVGVLLLPRRALREVLDDQRRAADRVQARVPDDESARRVRLEERLDAAQSVAIARCGARV